MKFKKGDKVRIIANKKQLEDMGIQNHDLTGIKGKICSLITTGSGMWYVDCGKASGGK